MESILTVTAVATSQALVSLDVVKEELSITTTDATVDARLTRQIAEESARIAGYCNRVFIRETVSEVIRFDSRDSLIEAIPLARRPIVSITSVTEETDPVLDAAYYEADMAGGLLFRLWDGYRTYWSSAKVTVVYVAGYLLADVPPALSAACLSLMRIRFATQGRDPTLRAITIEGVGEKQFQVAQSSSSAAFPPEIACTLDPYRRITL